MKQILALCDATSRPRHLTSRSWDDTITLAHRGPAANINLSIESPSSKLLAGVSDRSADLLKIASYVYAADQAVSRGGKTDAYGDSWRRAFTVCLPVYDYAFWSQDHVVAQLHATLGFVSEDSWEFNFARASRDEGQLPFDLNPNETLGNPDAVYLFSGGIDSLCAVVEAVARLAKPLLIGHSPAFHIANRQRELVGSLREKRVASHLPYLSVAVHRKTSRNPGDYNQRTRSFLYLAAASVISSRLGLKEVKLPDNGVVSINLPINEQLVGTKASRSTHPRFLRLFSDLARTVLEEEMEIVNPLWTRTRAEVLEVLKINGVPELVESTNSCSHPGRSLPKLQPHCGTCSQCIDRRFATLAAGLEEHDPGERYRTDIFRQELPEGPVRTMALSYVRFGQTVARMTGEELFIQYPQLADCVEPLQRHAMQREIAETLAMMIQRHGKTVVKVLKQQIERNSEDLAGSKLPDNCLLRLVAAPVLGDRVTHDGQEEMAAAGVGNGGSPRLTHSPDFSTVEVNRKSWNFVGKQAKAIGVFIEQWKSGVSELNQQFVLTEADAEVTRLRDLFRGSPAWGTLIVAADRKGFYRLNLD